ncbi:MAG: alpha/beta fold hydrolase [Candidatus Acidiferrales bacterium]
MQKKTVTAIVSLTAAMALTAIFVALLLLPQRVHAQEAKPVQFKAADGVTVYGVYYAAPNSSQPMILLFHQAGSNHYEYAGIAPKLVAAGFSCLAIDQRWGGIMWGRGNQTVRKLGHTETAAGKVEDLEADLEAALAWAHEREPHRKFILWGSSYSASLVFVVAAEHPDEVAGVLAFSPGEYFETHPTLVRDAAMKVHVPVFVTSENDADALTDATRIYDAVASRDKVHYRAKFAVHGSSTLRADRNPKGADANWQAVMKFLGQFQK